MVTIIYNKSRFIDLFHLSNTMQYKPSKAIYLWCINNNGLKIKIIDNVSTALWQIRLRREHEINIGKHYLDRANKQVKNDVKNSPSIKKNTKS